MGAVLAALGFGGDEGGGDAAVKRQAEGLSNPMYQLANLMGQVSESALGCSQTLMSVANFLFLANRTINAVIPIDRLYFFRNCTFFFFLSCLCNIDHNTRCLLKANCQGLLVDLSKKAMITQNYKELDDAIRMKIPQYLYNGGKVCIYGNVYLC